VLAGLAGLLTLGGVAWATIPAGDGTIYGCYDTGGAKPPYPLSVVDDPQSCGGTLLAFNQHGPAGPAGPGGPQGEPGPQGNAGPAGLPEAPAIYRVNLSNGLYGVGTPARIDRRHQTVTFHAYIPQGTYLATATVSVSAATLPPSSSQNYSATVIRCAIDGAYADGGETGVVGDRAWYGYDGGGASREGRNIGQRYGTILSDETPVSWPGRSDQAVLTCGRAGLDAATPADSVVYIGQVRIVAIPISDFHTNPPAPAVSTYSRSPMSRVREHIPTSIRPPNTRRVPRR
jgi:hypothetical protein